MASARVCSELESYKNKDIDASSVLQLCIDNSIDDKILEIPAGNYVISHQIKIIDKPITIKTNGLIEDDSKCALEDERCAELISSSELNENAGMIYISGDNVNLDHIIFNGNKIGRQGTPTASACSAGNNVMGYNVGFHSCTNCKVTNSVFENAVCATGFIANMENSIVEHNTIANNGFHYGGLWSDGITSLKFENSKMRYNEFIDNTDVDLIFGGGKNSIIQYNYIKHTNNFAGSTFAGLMIHQWPGGTSYQGGTTGDYTGSDFSYNIIDCGIGKRCGFGIMVGGDPWYYSECYSVNLHDNIVKNTQQGINIDHCTNMQYSNNKILNSGGVFYSKYGITGANELNIAPGSSVIITDEPKPSFSSGNWDGNIANWVTPGTFEDLDRGAFIKTAYLFFLDRPVEKWEYDINFGQVDNVIGRQSFLVEVFKSAPFQERYQPNLMSNEDFVRFLYSHLLMREPSLDDFNIHINSLNSGMDRNTLAGNFIYSAEFSEKFVQNIMDYSIEGDEGTLCGEATIPFQMRTGSSYSVSFDVLVFKDLNKVKILSPEFGNAEKIINQGYRIENTKKWHKVPFTINALTSLGNYNLEYSLIDISGAVIENCKIELIEVIQSAVDESCLKADVNSDGQVNILDLIFVRGRMNQNAGIGDNNKADVNNDGKINILDLIFVRGNLGKTCRVMMSPAEKNIFERIWDWVKGVFS